MSKKSDAERARAVGAGYAAFMRMRHRAMELRDADAFRKVRSEAWIGAGGEASIEQRILAANVAETSLRLAMGITEPLETTMPASSDGHPFPSDARSIEMFNKMKTE